MGQCQAVRLVPRVRGGMTAWFCQLEPDHSAVHRDAKGIEWESIVSVEPKPERGGHEWTEIAPGTQTCECGWVKSKLQGAGHVYTRDSQVRYGSPACRPRVDKSPTGGEKP